MRMAVMIVIITMVMMSIYSKPSAGNLDCFFKQNWTDTTPILYRHRAKCWARTLFWQPNTAEQNLLSPVLADVSDRFLFLCWLSRRPLLSGMSTTTCTVVATPSGTAKGLRSLLPPPPCFYWLQHEHRQESQNKYGQKRIRTEKNRGGKNAHQNSTVKERDS